MRCVIEDTKSASIALIAGSVGVAYWWYHLQQKPGGASAEASSSPAGSLTPNPGVTGASLGSGEPSLRKLKDFAIRHGLTPGSGLRPGDPGLHGEGRALDVPIPALNDQWRFLQDAKAEGINVLPEDYTGTRNGARSTGPHWHLSFPELRNGKLVW